MIAAASGCGSPPPAQVPAAPEPEQPQRSAFPVESAPPPESVVHAEFQTSARAVEPGGKFLLAVRFDIAPEYRISWSNPGDVGKSTQVRFQVPEGFTVGPLQYPAPTRFELPGKLVNYGYQGTTAVFAEVTAPARLPSDAVYRFDVRADWLACNDDCATESLDAWFELVSMRKAPAPELPDELRPHHAALPTSLAELPDAQCDWAPSSAQPTLELRASDVTWKDFLPADAAQPKVLAVKPARDALKVRFAGAASEPLRGLAVGEAEGKPVFVDVSVPWPGEELATSSR